MKDIQGKRLTAFLLIFFASLLTFVYIFVYLLWFYHFPFQMIDIDDVSLLPHAYPLHFIGVDWTEAVIADLVKNFSTKFSSVSSEIVPYASFANGETQVILKESVRGKHTFVLGNREWIITSMSGPKYNDKLIQELLITQCAKNFWAKGIVMDWIPSYAIFSAPFYKQHRPPFSFPSVSDIGSLAWGDISWLVDSFHHEALQHELLFPSRQEKVHLIATQDTADFVDKMKQYLCSVLWCDAVSSEVVAYQEDKFGRTMVSLSQSVEWKHTYVVADVNGKKEVPGLRVWYNDRLIQALLLFDLADKWLAKTVNTALTCFPYSRQDKPTLWWLKERVSREPSSAQFFVDVLEWFGIDYALTMDVHNPAVINNSRTTKFCNLYTWWFVNHIVQILQKEWKEDIVICPMDEWWLKKVSSISKDLCLPYLTVIKWRDLSKVNTVDIIKVYGDVQGKHIVVHDDMLDTWGSLIKLIKELNALGAASVSIVITHGMFNKDAIEKLQVLKNNGMFDKIYVTNSVYRDESFYPDRVEVIDCSPNFADPIASIVEGKKINYNLPLTPLAA